MAAFANSLIYILTLMVVSTVHAQPRCAEALIGLKLPSTLRGSTEPAPPMEIQYSGGGYTRLFKDGAIWQLQNDTWVHLGYGRYENNAVYEDDIASSQLQITRHLKGLLPDLRPLRSFPYNISRYEAERHYPNVKGNFQSLIHKLQIGSHNIEVVIPKNSGYENAADGIIRTIAELPLKRINALKTVRLNTQENKADPHWQKIYKDFTGSAATAGSGEIDIYGMAVSNFIDGDSAALKITRHEFGHLIASQLFGSTDPSNLYVANASRDRFAVSEYGNNTWAEDFAEGIEVYLRTNAGQLEPSLRSHLTNRFNFFDDVFSYRAPQSEKDREPLKGRTVLYVKMISKTEILALAPEVGLGILLKLD